MSGEEYVTICAVPALVQGLLRSARNATVETTPLTVFQADTMELIREGVTDFCRELAPKTILIAAALDPRFRKLKLLAAEQTLKVQMTVQKLVLEARITESERSTQATVGPAPRDKSLPPEKGQTSLQLPPAQPPAPVMKEKRMRSSHTSNLLRTRC